MRNRETLDNLDLAIRWSDKPSALRRVRESGLIPLHGRPKHFRKHNGVVALIGQGNKVKMTMRALAVDGPQKVVLANGKRYAMGYVVRADRRSIKFNQSPVPSPVSVFPAIGAFKYFDSASGKAILVGPKIKWSWHHAVLDSVGTPAAFRSHVHGIPGLPHNHPESILVDQYVSFMGAAMKFGHNYLPGPGLFVDLFDQTHWQLIEAKGAVTRDKMRMAIGQLQDYRRFYFSRHPSLAVLLPERPTSSCMDLLIDNHISVIWRTRNGSFRTRTWQTD